MTKILIVDDEPLVVISIRTMIERLDGDLYVAGTCSNGKEAFAYICAYPETDIVITDVDMPVMDGLELAEKLKEKNFHQTVLFLSAYGNFNYARKAFQTGAVDYILKTELDSEKLKTVLDRIVAERKHAGLTTSGVIPDAGHDRRRQFFRYLLDTSESSDAAFLKKLFDLCGFSVGFPFCFMILRPGDIPEVLARYRNSLADFANNTCGLLRQFVSPRGGDVSEVEYDQYLVIMKTGEQLEDVFFRFYDSAWTYLDTGFERRISPVIDNFDRFIAQYPASAARFLSFSRGVVRARRYIHEHYADPAIDLSEIASYAELSKNHLSRIFSEETGETVIEFLAKTRIQAAKNLLQETNLRTFEVADRIGFSNVETFCRVFKKITGSSPGKIRQ